MTLIAVSIMVDPDETLDACAERAARAVDDGARMIEWRVDRIVTLADGDSIDIFEV